MENKKFGAYTIRSVLGQGAMGKVYLAEDSFGRHVALKVILEQVLQQAGDPQEIMRRFKRESRFALELQHPNIVRTYDTGEINGTLYLACEVVKGGSLEDQMKMHAPLPQNFIIHTMGQVLLGLQEIHRQGFIHRDLKPANVLLDEKQVAKISDLGMLRSTAKDRTMYTREGQIMGTPYYMSPEQVRGDCDLDIRCDLYAFGAMFYHCLNQAPPFSGGSLLEILQKHLEQPIPAFMKPDVSHELQNFILRLLAKKREDRFSTPLEALTQLRQITTMDFDVTPQENFAADSDFPLGGTTVPQNAHATISGNATVLSSSTLSLSNLPLSNGLKTAKVLHNGQCLFAYAGNKLQIGRNAMGMDGQDICLRMLPGRGNEQNNKSISGKHFQIYIEGVSAFILDLGSRGGTVVNGKNLVANIPQKLANDNTILVAGIIQLQVQVITPNSLYPNEIDTQGTISELPAVFIRRINNTPQHLYALIPGKLPLTVQNGAFAAVSNSEFELLCTSGVLGYCASSNSCSLLTKGSQIPFQGHQMNIDVIEATDQK